MCGFRMAGGQDCGTGPGTAPGFASQMDVVANKARCIGWLSVDGPGFMVWAVRDFERRFFEMSYDDKRRGGGRGRGDDKRSRGFDEGGFDFDSGFGRGGGGGGYGRGGFGGGWGGGPSSGNRAFDEYRAETLRRLEDEQREFHDFLGRLRMARDKAEFDQFMNDRRNNPPANTPAQPDAA